jgi:DNA-binding MarR family transcriptional regulator
MHVRISPESGRLISRGILRRRNHWDKDCLDKCRENDYHDDMKTQVAPPSRRRFDSPEQETFLSLWRTYDRLRAHEEALFDEYGLSAQQYNALRLLRTRPALPTLALAARLISRAPDITRLLDHLETRGLISRERLAENRRVVQVRITAAGRELLDQLDPEVRACHRRQLGHMPRNQLRQLIELLRSARRPHESAEEWQ